MEKAVQKDAYPSLASVELGRPRTPQRRPQHALDLGRLRHDERVLKEMDHAKVVGATSCLGNGALVVD